AEKPRKEAPKQDLSDEAYDKAYDADASFEVIDTPPPTPRLTAADYAAKGLPAPPPEDELAEPEEPVVIAAPAEKAKPGRRQPKAPKEAAPKAGQPKAERPKTERPKTAKQAPVVKAAQSVPSPKPQVEEVTPASKQSAPAPQSAEVAPQSAEIVVEEKPAKLQSQPQPQVIPVTALPSEDEVRAAWAEEAAASAPADVQATIEAPAPAAEPVEAKDVASAVEDTTSVPEPAVPAEAPSTPEAAQPAPVEVEPIQEEEQAVEEVAEVLPEDETEATEEAPAPAEQPRRKSVVSEPATRPILRHISLDDFVFGIEPQDVEPTETDTAATAADADEDLEEGNFDLPDAPQKRRRRKKRSRPRHHGGRKAEGNAPAAE
ncbi:MAG: hypothetical protein Q4P78_08560, partial [Rothia sp. (in: high G+C Gram-positive bacteria)]|nr:hypothetical protein [Rothia sp. (in: high G+C Gram-positive bacteria)]